MVDRPHQLKIDTARGLESSQNVAGHIPGQQTFLRNGGIVHGAQSCAVPTSKCVRLPGDVALGTAGASVGVKGQQQSQYMRQHVYVLAAIGPNAFGALQLPTRTAEDYFRLMRPKMARAVEETTQQIADELCSFGVIILYTKVTKGCSPTIEQADCPKWFSSGLLTSGVLPGANNMTPVAFS